MEWFGSRKIKIVLYALVICFAWASFVQAHSIGQSLNQNVGGYTIDIGYDSITPNPLAGEATSFDFRFFKQPENNPAEYSDVSVDITQADGTTAFYADILHQNDRPTGMLYIFSQGGSYKLNAYYKKNGQTLAQASFPLTVDKADYEQPPQDPKKYWSNFISGAIVGIIFLCLIIVLRDIVEKRNKNK